MTTTLPEAPSEYDAIWAAELVRALQLALDTLSQPANKSVDGNSESIYTISDGTEKRVMDKDTDLDGVKNTLGTLIKDLQNKGAIQ